MTSNIAKLMNASLKAAKELLIATLLEYVRRLVQEWTYKNRILALSTGTKLTTRAKNDLRENYATSMKMKVIPSITFIYSVEDGRDTMTMKLKEKDFICGRIKKNVHEATVYPMPSKSDWDDPIEVESIEVLPLIGKISVGRPKKRRIKASWEGKEKNKCIRCGQRGHNKKTCRAYRSRNITVRNHSYIFLVYRWSLLGLSLVAFS
ncbi:uncharacterized protein LOC126672360 [Mercurialis annua]|uniref:uncharacterized protein LOC126672360 n=1 Tax=Mercurialis annua TaxID=3986 RepID=UPI00215EF776|nr:uncharacterized protein LOC126672360 [Mercurialis annua]